MIMHVCYCYETIFLYKIMLVRMAINVTFASIISVPTLAKVKLCANPKSSPHYMISIQNLSFLHNRTNFVVTLNTATASKQ